MDLIKDILIPQLTSRPISHPQDLVKMVFQSVMGGGHLISDPERSLGYIEKELSSLTPTSEPLFERIGERTCRYNLSSHSHYLDSATLNRLFCYSAQRVTGSREELLTALQRVKAAIDDGSLSLPFTGDEFSALWPREGEIPRHSEEYRQTYAPAYRVLSEECMTYYPLILEIDNHISNSVYPVVCIDGMAASGKTSLSRLLCAAFDACVFTPDDYFLTPAQRTPERLSRVGEFFDKERLYNEIIYPITQGRDTLSYRRYDCRTGSFTPMEKSVRKKLVVVEGVYSAHPFFGDYYDIGVFLRTDPETQSSRILARNGEAMHNRFLTEWIPRENAYFSAFAIDTRLSEKGYLFNT